LDDSSALGASLGLTSTVGFLATAVAAGPGFASAASTTADG
jgi:hypothetical protein